MLPLLALHRPPPPLPPLITDYEEAPPIPLHFWVQKLEAPLVDGSNVKLMVQYMDDGRSMPDTLLANVSARTTITLRDDGIAPDSAGHDKIYAAYVTENIDEFKAEMAASVAAIRVRGSYISFTGHTGQEITTMPNFDAATFDDLGRVELEPALLKGTSICGNGSLDREKSLFITDLSVVENSDRTYNAWDGTGTPMGAWTFGKLVQNIVNQTVSGITPKAFLKSWIQKFTYAQTVNGYSIPPRTDIASHLVEPWLRKCTPSIGAGTINVTNWETAWDAAAEADLLKYAPFKLTAIVNRIDLRGNAAYNTTVTDGGETRFIFTFVNTFYDPNDFLSLKNGASRNFGGSDFWLDKAQDW